MSSQENDGDAPTYLRIAPSERTAEKRLDALRKETYHLRRSSGFYIGVAKKLLLSTSEGNLPAVEVTEQWAGVLAEVVPYNNWMAAHIPLRGNTPIRLVNIRGVNFKDLEADILPLSAQQSNDEAADDSDKPNHLESPITETVPIYELYPLSNDECDGDDEEALSISDKLVMAARLDHCRFFYDNLWMPWDEDRDSDNWVSDHLETRMRLWQNNEAGDTYETLRLRELALDYAQIIDEGAVLSKEQSSDIDDELEREDPDSLAKQYLLEERRKNVLKEVDLLENPDIRNALSSWKQRELSSERSDLNISSKPVYHFVMGKSPVMFSQIKSIVDSLQAEEPDDEPAVQFHEDIEDAVSRALPGDIITLQLKANYYANTLSTFSGVIRAPEAVDLFCLDKPDDNDEKKQIELQNVTIISSKD